MCNTSIQKRYSLNFSILSIAGDTHSDCEFISKAIYQSLYLELNCKVNTNLFITASWKKLLCLIIKILALLSVYNRYTWLRANIRYGKNRWKDFFKKWGTGTFLNGGGKNCLPIVNRAGIIKIQQMYYLWHLFSKAIKSTYTRLQTNKTT